MTSDGIQIVHLPHDFGFSFFRSLSLSLGFGREKKSNRILHFDHKSNLETQNDTTIWCDNENDVAIFMLVSEA